MLGGKHTTFESNNLIQNNRSVLQAFFPIEISNSIFAATFAICWRPLHFDIGCVQKEGEKTLPKLSVKLISECDKILCITFRQFIVRFSMMKFKIFGTI